ALAGRLAEVGQILRHDRVAGSGGSSGRISRISQIQVDVGAIVIAENVIRLLLVEVSTFEGMGSTQMADEVGNIHVQPFALISVEHGGEAARHGGEGGSVKQAGR